MSLITTNADLKAFCKTLENVPFITVDTEFLRDRTFYARLCLIQVSGPDRNAAAIDVLSSEEELDLGPLWELFDNPNILKVFHAARQDLEILWRLLLSGCGQCAPAPCRRRYPGFVPVPLESAVFGTQDP